MEKVSIDDVEPGTFDTHVHSDRRELSGPLNTADVAITYYALEPGERFSGSVHAHMDQEEVFIVVEGTATFEMGAPRSDADGQTGSSEGRKRSSDHETRDSEREIRVSKNEAIRFAPGEFQSGRNDTEDEVVAFALGAPRDSEDVRISRIPVLDDRNVACPDCNHDSMRIAAEGSFVCPDCGAELEAE